MTSTENTAAPAVMTVIAVGGGAANVLEQLQRSGLQKVKYVCVDTKRSENRSVPTVLLGEAGLGSGGNVDYAREAAEEASAQEAIRQCLIGAHFAVVIACLGGGTGSGAAPVVARVAREMGIFTIGLLIQPYLWEGAQRTGHAQEAVLEMENNVDALVVFSNDRLQARLAENSTVQEGFTAMNDTLLQAVSGLCDMLPATQDAVTIDLNDIRSVLNNSSRRMMMYTGEATAAEGAGVAAERALACCQSENGDLAQAQRVLINVTVSRKNLNLAEMRKVMQVFDGLLSEEANIVYGTHVDDHLGEVIRLTLLASTGLAVAE